VDKRHQSKGKWEHNCGSLNTLPHQQSSIILITDSIAVVLFPGSATLLSRPMNTNVKIEKLRGGGVPPRRFGGNRPNRGGPDLKFKSDRLEL
jgi:hypothetical protein